MPIYEVEGPDGKLYEFDAPDPDALDAAVTEAFGGSGNSPVTSKAADEGGFLRGAGDFAKDVGGSTMAMINEGLNAATFGLTGQAERLSGAALMAATNDNPDMTYGDFLEKMDASTAQRRKDHAIAATGGAVIGSVVPAVASGGASTATQAASKMLGDGAGKALAGRVLASTGYGAAENAAIEAGRGNVGNLADMAQAMGTGAAFGAGGQLAGEALEPVGRFIGSRLGNQNLIRRAALERLGHSIAEPTPGPGNIASALGYKTGDDAVAGMYDAASRTGGDAGVRFGETSDDMLRVYAGNVADPQTIGLQGPTKELARQRVSEIGKDIRTMLRENLADVNSPQGAQVAKTLADVDAGKQLYEDIFDTPVAAAKPVITKESLLDELYHATDRSGKPIFDPGNATPAQKATWERLEKTIMDIGGDTRPDLTMKALQNLKIDEIDRLAHSLRSPTNASQNLSSRAINSVRSVMDEVIEGIDPRYAEARKLYASGPEMERAQDFGRNFIKGTNTSVPLDDAAEEISAMTARQKVLAQEEALDWMIGQLDQSDAFVNKLANNPAMLQRIDALFGTALSSNSTNVEDVLGTIGQMARNRKVYSDMERSIERNLGQAAMPANIDRAQDAADVAGIAARTAAGYPVGAANANAARRLMRPDIGSDARLLSDLLQAPNPTTANRLLDEIMAARNAPSASMYGGVAGVGAAAGLGTIMDTQRRR